MADPKEYLLTRKIQVQIQKVLIEAMMLSFAIDAKENRYLIVSYIPGKFLHANMD